MKFVRYGAPGREKPGLVDAEGRLRDLSGQVAEIDESVFGPAGQKRLRKLDPASLPLVRGTPRLGVPYVGISKFIAIGLNYRDHAAETNAKIPAEPVVFMKATSCIQGPDDPVMLPKGSVKSDWEVELGVVIGRTARYLSQFMVLRPGDLINTGTPAGVALGLPDHPYLRAGDVVELEISGLGAMRQTVGQA